MIEGNNGDLYVEMKEIGGVMKAQSVWLYDNNRWNVKIGRKASNEKLFRALDSDFKNVNIKL